MNEHTAERDLGIQKRAIQLASGIFAPFGRMERQTVLGFAGSAVAGLGVGLAMQQPLLGAAIGSTLSVVSALIAWWPFTNPSFRAAAELWYDHDCHERALWKKETGTSMPRGIRAVERWLRAHPKATLGRASLLLVTGRLAEFDQILSARRARTAEERFDTELLRETRSLLTGGSADIARLRAEVATIPNARERRHRLECLALLEGQATVNAGADPVPVLASARAGLDRVYWSMRASSLLVKWALIPIALVTVVTMIVAAAS